MDTQILVVDDDLELCELIVEIADIKSYRAVACQDATQVENFLLEHPSIQVIFLDLNMPDRDGIEVLRGLANEGFQGYILLMSGFDESVLGTAYELAKEYGLTKLHTLKKPFGAKALMDLIDRYDFQQSQQTTHQPSANPPKYSYAEIINWLENDQVEMHYQPQLFLKNQQTYGVEALVRLKNNDGQLVFPNDFIPIIEAKKCTKFLFEKVLEAVCRDYAQYHAYLYNLQISLNVSALDLDRLSFPDELAKRIAQSKINPHKITIEMTESCALERLSTGLDILARLRLKGFHLSIDDFGTGQAVLGNIRKMPFNELKIDKSFVDRLFDDDRTCTLTKDLIQLSKNLNLSLVAEGIEDAKTADLLDTMGCDLSQGYYFAKPMPMPKLIEWLIQHPREDSEQGAS